MKRITLLIFLLCAAMPSMAWLNPYAAVRGGYENTKEKAGGERILDGGGVAGTLALGNSFSRIIRAEITYTYKNFGDGLNLDSRSAPNIPISYDDGNKVTQQSLLANLLVYPLGKNKINPFVGAGLGLGFNKIHSAEIEAKNKLIYAFYLGLDFLVTKNIAVEAFGNYSVIHKPHAPSDGVHPIAPQQSSKIGSINNFGFNIGLRYNF
jgi:opacity protein-like surface antigen